MLKRNVEYLVSFFWGEIHAQPLDLCHKLICFFLTGYKIHDNYVIISPEDQQADAEVEGEAGQERNNSGRASDGPPRLPPHPNANTLFGAGNPGDAGGKYFKISCFQVLF